MWCKKKELTVFSESTSITEKSFDWKWQMWILNIKHSYYYYTNFVYSNKLTMKRMGKKQRWSSCCQQDILSHAGMGTWCIVFFETYYKIWMIIHKNAFSKLQSEKITAFVILTDQLLGKETYFLWRFYLSFEHRGYFLCYKHLGLGPCDIFTK